MNKKKVLIINSIILALLTIIIHILDLDMKIQSFFYRNGDWYLKKNIFIKILYDYGPVLGIVSGVWGLVLIIINIFKKKKTKNFKIGLFVFMLLLVGPGIFVNAIFKEFYGRPRPRQLKQFGGDAEFVPVLIPGKFIPSEKYIKMIESKKGNVQWDMVRKYIGLKGKYNSFPCGHASIGFFLIFPFFIFYNSNKKRSYIFLFLGICFGSLMGLGRVIQGAHFFSDVIWAYGMVFYSGFLLDYIVLRKK